MSLARSKPVTGPLAPWYGRPGGPYQATAAFTSGFVPATCMVVEPPQHQPVTPIRSAFTLGLVLAQSAVALRSPRVCSRFCASTIFSTSCTLGIWATPPSRTNSSGATAQ
jgi:hypothetical protein